MATRLNTQEQEIFIFSRMTRPTLGPTQPHNAGILSWESAVGGVKLITHRYLVPSLRVVGGIHLLLVCFFIMSQGQPLLLPSSYHI